MDPPGGQQTARTTVAGFEAVAMIRKEQVHRDRWPTS
jgi:hypothetical protein